MSSFVHHILRINTHHLLNSYSFVAHFTSEIYYFYVILCYQYFFYTYLE